MAGEKKKKTDTKAKVNTKAQKDTKTKPVGKAKTAAAEKAKPTAKAKAKPAAKAKAKPAAKPKAKVIEQKTRPPAPKAPSPVFVKNMEKSLLELKSEIVNNLVANNNDFKEIVEGLDPKDLADIASDDIDRKMIEAIGSQELKRLKLIDSAIFRIKEGKYGYCIKCTKPIPSDRLEAIPYALMCFDCKSEEERRNR